MSSMTPSDSNPVRQLIDEHVIFMQALQELSEAMTEVAVDAESLTVKQLSVAEGAWSSINEHLNVHFVKEEEIFFPFIERLIPRARVKFQFLHVDHDRLRENFDAYTNALQDYRCNRAASHSIGTLRRTAEEMIRLFYYHIVAEDTIYLDIAAMSLSAEESQEVLEEMKRLEDRLLERTVKLPTPTSA